MFSGGVNCLGWRDGYLLAWGGDLHQLEKKSNYFNIPLFKYIKHHAFSFLFLFN